MVGLTKSNTKKAEIKAIKNAPLNEISQKIYPSLGQILVLNEDYFTTEEEGPCLGPPLKDVPRSAWFIATRGGDVDKLFRMLLQSIYRQNDEGFYINAYAQGVWDARVLLGAIFAARTLELSYDLEKYEQKMQALANKAEIIMFCYFDDEEKLCALCIARCPGFDDFYISVARNTTGIFSEYEQSAFFRLEDDCKIPSSSRVLDTQELERLPSVSAKQIINEMPKLINSKEISQYLGFKQNRSHEWSAHNNWLFEQSHGVEVLSANKLKQLIQRLHPSAENKEHQAQLFDSDQTKQRFLANKPIIQIFSEAETRRRFDEYAAMKKNTNKTDFEPFASSSSSGSDHDDYDDSPSGTRGDQSGQDGLDSNDHYSSTFPAHNVIANVVARDKIEIIENNPQASIEAELSEAQTEYAATLAKLSEKYQPKNCLASPQGITDDTRYVRRLEQQAIDWDKKTEELKALVRQENGTNLTYDPGKEERVNRIATLESQYTASLTAHIGEADPSELPYPNLVSILSQTKSRGLNQLTSEYIELLRQDIVASLKYAQSAESILLAAQLRKKKAELNAKLNALQPKVREEPLASPRLHKIKSQLKSLHARRQRLKDLFNQPMFVGALSAQGKALRSECIAKHNDIKGIAKLLLAQKNELEVDLKFLQPKSDQANAKIAEINALSETILEVEAAHNQFLEESYYQIKSFPVVSVVIENEATELTVAPALARTPAPNLNDNLLNFGKKVQKAVKERILENPTLAAHTKDSISEKIWLLLKALLPWTEISLASALKSSKDRFFPTDGATVKASTIKAVGWEALDRLYECQATRQLAAAKDAEQAAAIRHLASTY